MMGSYMQDGFCQIEEKAFEPIRSASKRQLCDMFTRGLLSKEMRKRVSIQSPQSLDDAIIVALAIAACDVSLFPANACVRRKK